MFSFRVPGSFIRLLLCASIRDLSVREASKNCLDRKGFYADPSGILPAAVRAVHGALLGAALPRAVHHGAMLESGIHLHVLMHGSRNFIAAKTGIDHAKDHGNMGEKDKEQQDEDMAFGIFLGVRAVTNKAELREKKQEGGDDAKDIGPDRDKVDGAPPLNGGDVARN